MCARYFLKRMNRELLEQFGIYDEEEIEIAGFDWRAPRYDIGIFTQVPIVRSAADGGRELASAKWGLIPHFSREEKASAKSPHPFNAVGETLLAKSMFATPLKAGRRCVLPASGYIEWQWQEKRKRIGTRYLVSLKTGEPFGFAGLWNTFRATTPPYDTATIVTTEPNPLARRIHHRMPVMLVGPEIDLWLDREVEDFQLLTSLLKPRDADEIEIRPARLDSANDPENVEPIGPALTSEHDST